MKKIVSFIAILFFVFFTIVYFSCPIAQFFGLFDDRCMSFNSLRQDDARVSLQRFQSLEDALHLTQSDVRDIQEKFQQEIRAAVAEEVIIETSDSPQIVNQFVTQENIITSQDGVFAYDDNTVSRSEGVYECKNDGDVLQWEREDFRWECRTPTHTIFNDTDDATTQLQSDGALECRTDGHVLMWDKIADHWKCVDPASTEGGQALTGITVDPSGSFVYTDENGDETVVRVANLETLTSIVVAGSIISYVDEDSITTNIDIANLETTTNLIIDPLNQAFTYTNEDGVGTTISIAALETLTTFTNLQDGNLIGTYTDEDGVPFDIDETITKLVDNGDGTFAFTHEGGGVTTLSTANLETTTTLVENTDGTFTYINEDGTVTIVTIANLETLTSIFSTDSIISYVDEDGITTNIDIANLETTSTLIDNPNGTFTYDNEDGVSISIDHKDFTYNAATTTYVDGKISCISDGYILQWSSATTQWDCTDILTLETTTTITDNADGTFTYVNEDGVGVTVDHKDMVYDAATATYADGKIQCLMADHLLQWDGVQWGCIDITDLETVTALADNVDGTFTYTSEDNTITIVDTKDFAYDATTVTYADGEVSCVNDGQVMQWDGVGAQWSCQSVADLETTTTITDNADGTFTYANEAGGSTTVDHKDFDYNAATTTYADGKLQCLTDNHILQWDAPNSQWDCTDLNSIDGSVTVTDNIDGTFTIVVLDAAGVTTTTTVDHKDMAVDGTSALYTDGTISCVTDDEILQWDALSSQWTCADLTDLETITALTDNADGTFTYVNEAGGVGVTVDHKDFDYNAATTTYADGKLQCLTDNHILQWDSTSAQWGCEENSDIVTTLADNADGTITYTSEDATVTTFDHTDFVYDATTITYADGKVSCLTDGYVMLWDTGANQWMCSGPDGFETVTTLTDNPDGTFTYVSEDSTVTSIDHTDFAFEVASVAYTDGKVSCVMDGHVLQWDAPDAQWRCVATEVDEICDGDDDTCVYVDQGDADPDAISFLLDGAEHFRMTGSTLTGDRRATLEVLNSGESVFIGEQAGWVDNYSNNRNTFVGYQTGQVNTTGDENVFLGHQSGNANTTGRDNAFLGKDSGLANTTGYLNTFVGHDAGRSNTTGYQNTFVGSQSGEFNTTGRYNTAIGLQSSENLTTGQYNLTAGYRAGQLNTTGLNNVFLGRESGSDGLGGTRNYGIGYRALGNITDGGNYNIGLGDQAGDGLTTQDYNTFIGYRAGRLASGDVGTSTYIGLRAGEDVSGGVGTLALGYEAGEAVTGGTYNTYVGFRSGEVADGGNQNNFFGSYAGRNAQSGSYNTALGYYAGDNIATGVGNNIFGYTAGRNVTGGNYNSFIGYAAGREASGGTHNQALGYQAARDITGGSGNLLLGYNAGVDVTGGNYSSYIGRNAGQFVAGGSDNIGIGYSAAQNLITGSQNTFLGSYSGQEFDGGNYNSTLGRYTMSRSTGGNYNVALGEQAGRDVSGGSYNIMGGYQAGYAVADGSHNLMLGYRAGRNFQGGTYNNIIGRDAGYSIVNASHNDIYGAYAGQNLDGGNYNVLTGYTAGRYLTSGDDNVFVGRGAGVDATTATQNIGIGYNAGQNLTTALRNVAIGQNALGLQTTGNENIGIGYQAGYRNVDGSSNVFIGRQAGRGSNVNGSNNVFLGNRAGYSETGSNKLYIEGGGAQYAASNSLIYGEFDNDLLRFNADVGIGTGAPAERLHVIGNILATGTITPSDRRFKTDIQQVDSALEQLLKIRGTTYDYKENDLIGTDRVNTHQYGVIAQEVESVFPDLVENYDFDGDGTKDYKAVNYTGLTPVMIEAIRDLSDESDATSLALIQLGQDFTTEFDAYGKKVGALESVREDEAQSSILQFIDGAWNVVDDLIARSRVVFEKVVVFMDRVTFADRVTFGDPDMAGYVEILEGEQSVRVTFENAFDYKPVVTTTSHDGPVLHSIDNLSHEGFEIVLYEKADETMTFAWIAIATTQDEASNESGDEGEEREQSQSDHDEEKEVEKNTDNETEDAATVDQDEDPQENSADSTEDDAVTEEDVVSTPAGDNDVTTTEDQSATVADSVEDAVNVEEADSISTDGDEQEDVSDIPDQADAEEPVEDAIEEVQEDVEANTSADDVIEEVGSDVGAEGEAFESTGVDDQESTLESADDVAQEDVSNQDDTETEGSETTENDETVETVK